MDAGELQVEHIGERADQERFSQAGHSLQEAMAAHEQTCQDPVNDLVMSHDYPAYLLLDSRIAILKLGSPFLHRLGDTHRMFLFG